MHYIHYNLWFPIVVFQIQESAPLPFSQRIKENTMKSGVVDYKCFLHFTFMES